MSSEGRLERAEECVARVLSLAEEHEEREAEQAGDLATQPQVTRSEECSSFWTGQKCHMAPIF